MAITLAVVAVMAIPPARQLYAQNRTVAAEQMRLDDLRRENTVLQQRLDRLNDPEYVEKLAREQLGMVRPGEIAYVIVPPEASIDEKPPPPKPRAWYQKAWDWLKDLAGAG